MTESANKRTDNLSVASSTPARNEPDVVTGATGWRRMRILIAAAAGIEMKVDRSVVRVYRRAMTGAFDGVAPRRQTR